MLELEERHSKLLETLTRNCRANVNAIARQTGLSRTTVKKRLKRLEKEYGLKYVLSINRHKLGISFNVLIKAKLKKEVPEKELRSVLSKSYIPQFAALTKGDFDLVIFASALDSDEFDEWDVGVRKELNNYIESWDVLTVLKERYGFFPPSQNLLAKARLKPMEKEILGILNKDVRTPIKDIASQLKMSSPLVKYHLKKLEKSKLFEFRLVFTEKVEPDKLIIFTRAFVPKGFTEINHNFRNFMIGNIRNLCYFARLTGDSDLCTIGSFDNMDKLYDFQGKYKKSTEKMAKSHSSAIILKTIIGDLRINPFESEEKYAMPAY
jgi:DNA-binding Lrp family transcriptional regulator